MRLSFLSISRNKKNNIHYLNIVVLECLPRGKNGNLHAKNLIPGSIARRANVAEISS
jgi:hypothetical protein